MSNSFYYFFSAVPQVLAAILALFGVFVIFKIQALRTELLALGKSIFDKAWYLNQTFRELKISKEGSNISLLTKIKELIERNSIDLLKYKLTRMEQNEKYDPERALFFEKYYELNSLIKRTILWSSFTAFTIILCLIFLTIGSFILCHNYLVISLFALIIVCLIICFFGLISILSKALSDANVKE